MPASSSEDTSLDTDEISETQILQMLHRKKMILIEQRFEQKEKGLPIQDFLSVMLQHLDYDKNNQQLKLKITLALIDFFKEVDVNGDQTMEWEQFSNHIIELGLLRNDRSFKNLIKSYFPSEKVQDKEKHQTGIENIYYYEKLKNLFMIEKESPRFKVYNVNTASLLYQVNAHKGNILDLEYLENQNLIATSSNDLTINFWDAASFTLKQIVSVPEIQLKMRYADWKQAGKQLLYTGGSDAVIHIYDAVTLKERGTISGWNPFYKSDQQQQGHSSPIGDILPIDSQQTLATACLGGSICLWDSNTHQLKKELRGHDKGVYSLDWCDWSQMNQCLLSAGLDHEAFVWNTYVKDKIFLLRGHNHPLVSVKCLPQTPQIITGDISGMVKVWDVRNFLCMQTFNAPAEQLSAFCLTYATGNSQSMKKRVICAGKKMHYFEYDEPRDQLLTDQKPCLSILFNYTLLCIITLHSDCLKVWDARNGRLLSVYRGLSNPNQELTAMVLDNRERKLFVGDSQGCLFTVNIKNGAKMKQFQKHQQPITDIRFWSSQSNDINDQRYVDLRRIISISMSTQVNIHDQDAPQDAKSSCRYVMKQHKDSCNSIAIRKGSEIIATASDDGHTIITNLISYRHQVLPELGKNQIKLVMFLDPYEALINFDVYGKVTFYGIGDSKLRNKILFEKQYVTESMTQKMEAFQVTCAKFDPNFNLLILGDQFGNIEYWELDRFLDMLSQHRAEKSVLARRREKILKHSKSFMTNAEVEGIMLTELKKNKDDQLFSQDMVTIGLRLKGIHNDGITCIELIKQNDAFITSSFDCCCYIWRIVDGVKIGSLLLGGDINWKLSFNMDARHQEAIKEAEQLLRKINTKKTYLYSESALKDDKQLKEFEIMRQNVLKNAKELIEAQKKSGQKNDQQVDLLGQTIKREQQYQGQDIEQQQNQFSLIKQLNSMRGSVVTKGIKKKK